MTNNKFTLPIEYFPKMHIILLYKNEEIPDISNIKFILNTSNTANTDKFDISLLEEQKKKSDEHNKLFAESLKNVTIALKTLSNNKEQHKDFFKYLIYDDFTKKRSGDREYDKIYNIDTIGVWTSAWKKIFEIIKFMKLIDNDNDNDNHRNKLKHFDICSFPCSFIFGINHYIKTETDITTYDWYSQSYVDSEMSDNGRRKHFGYGKGLKENYPNRFLLGAKESGCNGDITDINNIKSYLEFFNKDKLDLITSDCGISNSKEEGFDREKEMLNIYFSQLICSLGILKKGGNIVMKTYSQFQQFSFCNICLMTLLFEKVYLVKPEASSNYGHEVYMIGKNYYDNLSKGMYQQLLDIVPLITSKDYNKTFISSKYFNKDKIKILEKKISEYYSHVFNIRMISLNIFKNQIESLIKTPELIIPKIKELNTITWRPIKNHYEKYMKKLDLKKIDDEDKIVNW